MPGYGPIPVNTLSYRILTMTPRDGSSSHRCFTKEGTEPQRSEVCASCQPASCLGGMWAQVVWLQRPGPEAFPWRCCSSRGRLWAHSLFCCGLCLQVLLRVSVCASSPPVSLGLFKFSLLLASVHLFISSRKVSLLLLAVIYSLYEFRLHASSSGVQGPWRGGPGTRGQAAAVGVLVLPLSDVQMYSYYQALKRATHLFRCQWYVNSCLLLCNWFCMYEYCLPTKLWGL